MHLLWSDIMADGHPQQIFLRLLPSSPSTSSILHLSTGHNQFTLLICDSVDFTFLIPASSQRFRLFSMMASMTQTPQMGRVFIGNGEVVTWEHLEDISMMRHGNSSSLSLSSESLPASVGGHDIDIDSNASEDESRAYHIEDVLSLTSTNIALFRHSEISQDSASTSTSQSLPAICVPHLADDPSDDSRETQTGSDSTTDLDTPTRTSFHSSSSADSTPTLRNSPASSECAPAADDSSVYESVQTLSQLSMAGQTSATEQKVLEEEKQEESSDGSMTGTVRVDSMDNSSPMVESLSVNREIPVRRQREVYREGQLLPSGKVSQNVSHASSLP
ncbi:hypothetical protein VTN00DRAFT_6986 [Thermoascus crustaceus]|uniref:uncharacterized protein n=1 Tax=Thermoascus crustaceus TaxID=5088 RepID=UPI003743ECAE